MAHRVARQGEAELDAIWYYLAKESASIEIADRMVDSITERFFLLSRFPHVGRRRDEDFDDSRDALQLREFSEDGEPAGRGARVVPEAAGEEAHAAAVHAEARTAVVPQRQGAAEGTGQRVEIAGRNLDRNAEIAIGA
jgi:plasmid stabilization system protein ParE